MLNISYNVLNTELQVKNRTVVWVQCASVSAVHPGDHAADAELWLPPPSIARQYHTAQYRTVPRNGQDSKFQVSFLLNAYCFQNIVKSKNSKWNPYKSGTGDIYVLEWKDIHDT